MPDWPETTARGGWAPAAQIAAAPPPAPAAGLGEPGRGVVAVGVDANVSTPAGAPASRRRQ